MKDMIAEVDSFKKEIRNLKAKVKRRLKKLDNPVAGHPLKFLLI